ncbi:MAG TPA: hypothetical protein VEP91_11530 [Solirubrobacterales bacterium]|nr:hypothetical protein [Solirubrobacterales bacterium]
MADDRLHPLRQLARISGRGFAEEDLEPALQGFVGVVVADREAAGDAPQGRLVAGEDLDRGAVASGVVARLQAGAGPLRIDGLH